MPNRTHGMRAMQSSLLIAALLIIGSIEPANAEPVSMSIGLTALIAGATGTSVAIGGIASIIGGFIVTSCLSRGLSIGRRP